jgi:hypothetical protein
MNSRKNFESLKEEKGLIDETNSRNKLHVSTENVRSVSPQRIPFLFPKLAQMPERSERFTARRNSNIIDLKQVKLASRRRSSIQPKIELSSSFCLGIEKSLLSNSENQNLQKTPDSINDKVSYEECMILKYIP